jgi:hypothetical protein
VSKITLIKTHQISPEIRQSRLRRDWMDDTYNKHAYRCLPLSHANVNGWEVVLQQDVKVIWAGGNSVPQIIEGEVYKDRTIANCNKIGMIDFHIGWAFRTDPGYYTYISGPPNYFIDGAVPLTANIPSDWWPDEVQAGWKITKVNEPVTFPAGMPFLFFMIFPSNLMEQTILSVEYLWDKPELMNERMAYSNAKMTKLQEEPWTWMNGIRTGLNEKGERIGPRHDGLPNLMSPTDNGVDLNELDY